MKYKILKGIAETAIQDKSVKRAFETYFKLKALNTSGCFAAAQYAEVAQLCHITLPTFYTRIKEMRRAGLILEGKSKFNLLSYKTVANKYNTDPKDCYYTRSSKLQLVIDSLPVRHAKMMMNQAAIAKGKRNGILDDTMIAGPKGSLALKAVLNSQIADHQHSAKTTDKALYAINPDDNLNYATLSLIFNYKGFGSMAYKKRLFVKHGLATIQPRKYRIHEHRYESVLGHVCYFRPEKKRILVMCDDICFN